MGFFDRALGPLQFQSSAISIGMVVMSSAVFATTTGYDTALINGINILPSYTQTLKLTTATKSLNSAASFLGWAVVSTFMGPVVDRVGRRTGVLISVILKIIGVALMSSAQEVAMFVIGRMVLGAGSGTSSIAASTWLAETLPSKYRASGLSFIFTVYYVGALIAAGVTFKSADLSGTWSWRMPCILQALFSVVCGLILLFVPESPRWLVHKGRLDEALEVVASMNSNGNKNDPETKRDYEEIIGNLAWERENGKQMNYAEILRTPNSRRRLALVVSVAILAMGSGNNIVSYYLGDMLSNAGITSTHTQLEINIILNAWCLIIALIGTVLMNVAGRKTMCLISCACMTVFIFLVGALTKLYGNGGNTSGVYGTVATIFLFQGSYAIGITPLTILYPPEVLNFAIRSNGMAAWTFSITCGGLFSVFVWPFALKALGWKTYMINGCWDAVMFAFVAFFWIETRGLSLEEVDAKFEEVTGGGRVQDPETYIKTIEGVQMDCKTEEVRIAKIDSSVASARES